MKTNGVIHQGSNKYGRLSVIADVAGAAQCCASIFEVGPVVRMRILLATDSERRRDRASRDDAAKARKFF